MRAWSAAFVVLAACSRTALPIEVHALAAAGSSAATCGDDRLDPGEECDGRARVRTTCRDLGFSGGVLRCDSACRYDISSCESTPPPACPTPEWPVSLPSGCAQAMCACDREAFSNCEWPCWSKVACQVATCNNNPVRSECAEGCADATAAELSLAHCYMSSHSCTQR